jgi:hypothetical protein
MKTNTLSLLLYLIESHEKKKVYSYNLDYLLYWIEDVGEKTGTAF